MKGGRDGEEKANFRVTPSIMSSWCCAIAAIRTRTQIMASFSFITFASGCSRAGAKTGQKQEPRVELAAKHQIPPAPRHLHHRPPRTRRGHPRLGVVVEFHEERL